VTFSKYANDWLNQRTDLAERTTELYRHVLDKHVLSVLGTSTLAGLSPTTIRLWHAKISKDHPATASKSYRLLSSIMRAAVAEGFIATSPCKVESSSNLPLGASSDEVRFSDFEEWTSISSGERFKFSRVARLVWMESRF
jgi:hypothetical protein